MPREIITVQVGQAGNQIGASFWSRCLNEHAQNSSTSTKSRTPLFDESMSTFFRNVDSRSGHEIRGKPIASLKGVQAFNYTAPISHLKARACLIDMEDGVLSRIMRGELGDLFETTQFLTDTYNGGVGAGSGNNWAQGYQEYGTKYTDNILELIRTQVECCESLQSFFVMHSTGGGTGSGLGSKVVEVLEDEYPEVYRFATSVLPSFGGEGDDVITSPYNTVMALNKLTEHADAVLPLDNNKLSELSEKKGQHSAGKGLNVAKNRESSGGGFGGMNNVVARLLTDLTASMRFAGDLNTDLNEITTNLVPFPKMHYLCPSLAPLWGRKEIRSSGGLGNKSVVMRALFKEGLSQECQLISSDRSIKNSNVLACGLFVRGSGIPISDVNANVSRIQNELRMPRWNLEGFKIGICDVAGVDEELSLLSLVNCDLIVDVMEKVKERFLKLYSRKAMVHHYTNFVDEGVFGESLESLQGVIDNYKGIRGFGDDGDGQGVKVWNAAESEKSRKGYGSGSRRRFVPGF